LAHWTEPVSAGSELCKGQEALETLYKEKPGDYLRLTASVLPREFIFESVTSELDDEQIDELLMKPAPSIVSACSCAQIVLAKPCAARPSWHFT
jgi:hypothetical protein